MAFILPTGFDRADGVTDLPANPVGSGGTGKVGTPTPSAALIVSNSNGDQSVEELPDSPEIERAEQATLQHRLTMSWASAKNYIVSLGRGTFLQDSFGNITRVLSSKIQSQRGGSAILSITAESISFDSPPDEFQIVPIELGINIMKHPRYFYALSPSGSDSTQEIQAKQSIIRAIQVYIDSPFFPDPNNVASLLGATSASIQGQLASKLISYTIPNPNFNPDIASTKPPPVGQALTAADNPNYLNVGFNGTTSDSVNLALAAAGEIITKLWRQEDNPYLAGFQITWSQYYFAPVFLNAGSYIENPIGIVPDYFMSPSQTGSDTIFDQLPQQNPQSYSLSGTSSGEADISWLRKSDEVEYQRTWFKVTRTWVGSPVGHWDQQLYSGGDRPSSPSDYVPLY